MILLVYIVTWYVNSETPLFGNTVQYNAITIDVRTCEVILVIIKKMSRSAFKLNSYELFLFSWTFH